MLNTMKDYKTSRKLDINHENDTVTFHMLTEPASNGGDMSRCQLTDMIDVSKKMLEYLNNKYPCRENAITITKLEEALMWQNKRTLDRIDRGVEGRNEI